MTNAPCTTPAANEDLIECLDRFNDELQSISDLLEQIWTDLQWGLQNGRVAFVLSEPESLDEFRDVTTGADTLTLAIRFHVALGQMREQLMTAIEGSREASPVAESATIADEVQADNGVCGTSPSNCSRQGMRSSSTWTGKRTSVRSSPSMMRRTRPSCS
ncbi:MAG: hypothetical protein R3B91_16340 [Planctomycetaceae bacterium]